MAVISDVMHYAPTPEVWPTGVGLRGTSIDVRLLHNKADKEKREKLIHVCIISNTNFDEIGYHTL